MARASPRTPQRKSSRICRPTTHPKPASAKHGIGRAFRRAFMHREFISQVFEVSTKQGTSAGQLRSDPFASHVARPFQSARSALMSNRVCASAVVLVLVSAGLGWPRSSFGQDKSAEGGAFRSQVDLVSVYFTVRDEKKRLVS